MLGFFLSLNTFAQHSKYVDPADGLSEIPAQGMVSVYLTLVLLAIFFIMLDKGGKQTFLRVLASLLGFFAYLGLIGKLGQLCSIGSIMIRLGQRWEDLGPAWQILGTIGDSATEWGG